MEAFGIDIGRSGVKISTPTSDHPIIPALAVPAFPIDDPEEAERAATDTVLVNGRHWFIGQTASVQGSPEPGNHSEFHRSEEYEALIAGVLRKLATHGRSMAIVGGLPSEATPDDKEHVSRLFMRYAPPGSKVKIIAQPAGALFSATALNKSLAQANVAIVDIGRYSTDLAFSRSGRQVQGSLQSAPGVRLAADTLYNAVRSAISGTPTFERLEEALRTGTLRHAMQAHDVRATAQLARDCLEMEVKRAIHALSTKLKGQIDHVVLAGGGADLIKLDVPFVLAPHGRHSISRGFAMYANSIAQMSGEERRAA